MRPAQNQRSRREGAARAPVLAVLAYHKIGDPPRGAWQPWFYVPPGLLAEQLAALRERGWTFVELAAAVRGLVDGEELPERSVLVTFDDGHRSVVERGLPALAAAQAPGVVFVPVAFVGGPAAFDAGGAEALEPLCSWDELRELEAGGVSVQSHGYRHLGLSRAGPGTLEQELARSKQVLEDQLDKTVEAFAYPYGDAGDAALVSPALTRWGYRAAFLYGGGAVRVPVADRFRVERIAVGADTDLLAAVSED